MALDEPTFERIADQTLHAMEEALGDADDRLEISLSMGVLTIAFEDGARYIVNSHRAARQIWMAAGARAWHFDWDGKRWLSSKPPHEELWRLVEETVSSKLGRSLTLQG